jgi:hypothetical protein
MKASEPADVVVACRQQHVAWGVTCHRPAVIQRTGPGSGASAAGAAWCACPLTSVRTKLDQLQAHGYVDPKERGDRYCTAEGAPSARCATFRTRSVHGEVACISNHILAHFLEVKRASPLQDHLRDLTFAFADMGPQPSRDVRCSLGGKRSVVGQPMNSAAAPGAPAPPPSSRSTGDGFGFRAHALRALLPSR